MEVDTSDEDIEHINLDNSSPTLIDVIDLTKESPRNRPSQPGRTRNASANPYVTKSSASYQHRRVVLPIVLGRRQNRTDFPPMKRRMRNNNEIVNLDDTIVLEEKKDEEAGKQKTDKQEADKYYTFQSDNADNKVPISLTCPICLETLSSRLKPTSTRCGHIFCAKCLEESIRKYKNCPTCKTTLKLKSCIRLYL